MWNSDNSFHCCVPVQIRISYCNQPQRSYLLALLLSAEITGAPSFGQFCTFFFQLLNFLILSFFLTGCSRSPEIFFLNIFISTFFRWFSRVQSNKFWKSRSRWRLTNINFGGLEDLLDLLAITIKYFAFRRRDFPCRFPWRWTYNSARHRSHPVDPRMRVDGKDSSRFELTWTVQYSFDPSKIFRENILCLYSLRFFLLHFSSEDVRFHQFNQV